MTTEAWAVKGPDGIDPNTITDSEWRAKEWADEWSTERLTYTAIKVRVHITEVPND